MVQDIPINIVFSYPVKWSKYQVLRDFVQNFYDAVPQKDWKQLFHFDYKEKEQHLIMEIEGDGFSYEWLLHIGASTKTDDPGTHAGFFGEGFKIASLCALRDYGWNVTMASRDWKLKVIKANSQIEGKNIEMLAYRISDVDSMHGSRLELDHISSSDFELFQKLQDSFYFPENPLFGEKIWEDNKCALFTRSTVSINDILPQSYRLKNRGVVFCSYQMAGTCPIPMVFCLHNYSQSDRERKTLYDFEVIDVVLTIASLLPPSTAMVLLEKMYSYWNHRPDSQNEINVKDWGPVINALIRNIRYSQDTLCLFRKKYPYLLCAEQAYSIHDKNRRHQALTWMSQERPQYKVVKGTFSLLGYPFLEDECEAAGGFVASNRLPTDVEKQCFDLVKDLISEIFPCFFIFSEGWPETKIITNQTAVYKGMASLYKLKKPLLNSAGIKVRYSLKYVHMKDNLIKEDRFHEFLSTYIHELCHIFGGDSSGNFSNALTLAMEILLNHPKEIEEKHQSWIHLLAENQ